MPKIIVLGGTGFVGHHVVKSLRRFTQFDVWIGSRYANTEKSIEIDITNPYLDLSGFDFVVNAAGYGVFKTQTDPVLMEKINGSAVVDLFDRTAASTFWIQIGTAFEYDLGQVGLHESSGCDPKTLYGRTKWVASRHILESKRDNVSVIRPFGMLGPGEEASKFFPALIVSQYRRQPIDLSSGKMARDYIFVTDFSDWIAALLHRLVSGEAIPKVINVGSGTAYPLRDWADRLSTEMDHFDPDLWRWGALPDRTNESPCFYNASKVAVQYGFRMSDWKTGFQMTIQSFCGDK